MLGSGTKTEYKLVGRPRGYYAAHRKEMDEGAVVAWPERYNVDELSAIQHAMNLKLRDELAFMAEYQQEPIAATGTEEKPSLAVIAERVNRLTRGVLPIWTNRLVAFIDVQAKALWYKVAAFADDFTGAFVDYGTEPEQPAGRDYFTLRNLKRTLPAALERRSRRTAPTGRDSIAQGASALGTMVRFNLNSPNGARPQFGDVPVNFLPNVLFQIVNKRLGLTSLAPLGLCGTFVR